MTMSDVDFPYLSPAAAAKVVGSSREWVYRRLRAGDLKGHKVAGTILIHRDDLMAMVQNAPTYIEKRAA
jgi:excisionase family DNA binding protein